MSVEPSSRTRRWSPPTRAATAVVAATGFVAAVVSIGRVLAPAPDPRIKASVAVTLSAAPAGTRVHVVIDTAGGPLPVPLTLRLPTLDDGYDQDGSAVFSRAALTYAELNPTPAASDKPAGIGITLPGGGHRAEFSYRVVAGDGRRVVFPVPATAGVRFATLTVLAPGIVTECWRGSGVQNQRTRYSRCAPDDSGRLPLAPGADIRLELVSL